METWGDIGASQASVAAADLSDTLHFGFTVLDAAGQPTDIPLYLTLAAVPEPLTAAMLLQGL